MSASCRFLHASDLHLEQVPRGLGEVAERPRAALAEAPYRAAARIFDAAIEEEVDFVLLVGDVLDARLTGTRGPLFLAEQFSRLAERQVGVYWLLAGVDRLEDWPAGLRLPANVHRLTLERGDELIVERREAPLARLVNAATLAAGPAPSGHGHPPGLAQEIRHLPLIVWHYGWTAARVEAPGAAYVAWGGLHARQTLSEAPLAHACGTPQGRTIDESGPHGCTLVEVGSAGKPQLGFIPTDAVRWHHERVVIPENQTRADVERLLKQRVAAWNSAPQRPPLVVEWTLVPPATARAWSRWRQALPELEAWLRGLASEGPAPVWTVGVTLEPPAAWQPALFEQESILAEYLRELTAAEAGETADWDLSHLLGAASEQVPAALLTDWTSAAARTRVLRRAAALGVELLSGEERDG